jgi:hypothetical protein
MSEADWLVMGVAIVIGGSAAGWQARRRREELVLTAAYLELAAVDSLAERQFTRFCAALLRVLGYRTVRRARARRGEVTDLVGRSADDAPVVIRCLRQRDPVDAAAVAALRAAVTSGPHAGRRAILVTTALVSLDARALAGEAEGSPVTVADRAVLRHWMEQARAAIARPDPAPRGLAGIRRDTRAVTGIVACAALAVLAVVIHASLSGSSGSPARSGPGGAAVSRPAGTGASAANAAAARGQPAASSPSAGASASPASASPAPPATPARPGGTASPRQVVRAFYAAISRHDWPQVWRLGGRNLGYGPYATYQGMVAGYAGTIRDEVTDLTVRGNVVSGHFRAYHAGGQVRTYRFSYAVRGGAITSGFQQDITV